MSVYDNGKGNYQDSEDVQIDDMVLMMKKIVIL
jgi:hypothetical protein